MCCNPLLAAIAYKCISAMSSMNAFPFFFHTRLNVNVAVYEYCQAVEKNTRHWLALFLLERVELAVKYVAGGLYLSRFYLDVNVSGVWRRCIQCRYICQIFHLFSQIRHTAIQDRLLQ